MMISNEQARLAAESLRNRPVAPHAQGHEIVSAEVIEAAVQRAQTAPDLREDRVAEAKARWAEARPDAHEVAEKMLYRILGDSVR